MFESQQPNLTRGDVLNAINRCVEAFNQVKAQLRQDSSDETTQSNHDAACRA